MRKLIKEGLVIGVICLLMLVTISGAVAITDNKTELVNDIEYSPLQVTFTRPENGIYIFDKKILPYSVPLILCGKVTVEAEVEPMDEVYMIEFYMNDGLYETIIGPGPYYLAWAWGGPTFLKTNFRIIAYAGDGTQASDEITIWRIFR